MDVVKVLETGGALGALVYFGKLFFNYLSTRSTRADQREQSLIELQREQQKVVSNHLEHMTDTTARLTHAIDNNTDATKAVVEVVDSCEMVQQARKKARE